MVELPQPQRFSRPFRRCCTQRPCCLAFASLKKLPYSKSSTRLRSQTCTSSRAIDAIQSLLIRFPVYVGSRRSVVAVPLAASPPLSKSIALQGALLDTPPWHDRSFRAPASLKFRSTPLLLPLYSQPLFLFLYDKPCTPCSPASSP